MTPHRGPSRQRHRRDGPVAAAAGPVGGIPATPCGPRRASAGRASPVTDSLRPTAPAWWPPAHVIRSLPARAPAHGAARAAWSRSCPPGLPATSPAPGRDPEAGARVVGAGAPSAIPAPPTWPAGIPGAPPTSPSVSPHGTFLRRFGTRATWHARCRLARDRPSPPVAPAPPGRRSRPAAPPWQGGSRHRGRTMGVGPPSAPLAWPVAFSPE